MRFHSPAALPRVLLGLATISVASLSACGGPWTQNLFQAIYGNDDRVEAAQVTDPATQLRIHATAGILPRSFLTELADGNFSYRTRSARPASRTPYCADEPFTAQPQLPGCTGVLIGPDLILTAGHCVDLPDNCNPTTGCPPTEEVCRQMAVVFDWALDPETGRVPETLQANQVANCQGIIAGEFNPVTHVDWALIRLDRLVTDRTPVLLAAPGEAVQPGTPVVQISHPFGWPLKVLAGAEIQSVQDAATFLANTDTYHGSSGGPLFNAQTGKLIGVFRGGVQDFFIDRTGPEACVRSRVCNLANPCRGEEYFRVDSISQTLRTYLGDQEDVSPMSQETTRRRRVAVRLPRRTSRAGSRR